MQHTPFAAFCSMVLSAGGRAHLDMAHIHITDELAYQATTVAAILLVLGSLWVF